MKITFINIYQQHVSRGSEVFVEELNRRLSEHYEINIIKGEKKEQRRIPFLWRLYLDPDGLSVLFFTLRNLSQIMRSDIVVPLNGGWQSVLVRLATWITGHSMVVVGQSGIGWDDRINLYCLPNIFVGISQLATDWAKRIMPKVDSVYIPNGVNLNLFNSKGNVFKHGFAHPVFLCVGALVPSKKIDIVIRAVSRIPKANLLIVGRGPLEKDLSDLITKLMPKRAKIINLDYKEMPSVYRSADCFTLVSSKSEAFGNVYVEALATNLPVVATLDEIRREIVGKAGILVDGENIDAYTQSLEVALAKKWGNAPQDQAQSFSWDIVAKRYSEIFKKI